MTRERLLAALDDVKAHARRDKPLSLRLSAVELKRLKKAARAQRVPYATLARVLLLGGLDELEGQQRR
ncbi:MAG: hypothetical protein ACHQQS_06635 [Thermoanaerobaculales bacterium]